MSRKRQLFNEDKFLSDLGLDDDLTDLITGGTGLVKKADNKKKIVSNFKIGDAVEANGSFGTVIFGPYNDAFDNIVYEIELEEGEIVTASEDKIAEYVPPVEEDNDDDGSL